jgi:hypothetical protein
MENDLNQKNEKIEHLKSSVRDQSLELSSFEIKVQNLQFNLA